MTLEEAECLWLARFGNKRVSDDELFEMDGFWWSVFDVLHKRDFLYIALDGKFAQLKELNHDP